MVRKTQTTNATQTTKDIAVDTQAVAAQPAESTDQHATDAGQPASDGAQPEAPAEQDGQPDTAAHAIQQPGATNALLDNISLSNQPISVIAHTQSEPVVLSGYVTHLTPVDGTDSSEATVDFGDVGEWPVLVANSTGIGGLIKAVFQDGKPVPAQA